MMRHQVSVSSTPVPGGDATMHHLGDVALDLHVVPCMRILMPEFHCGHQHGARVDVRSADPSVVNDHDSQCKEWPRHALLEGSEQGGRVVTRPTDHRSGAKRATDCVTKM